MAIREIVLAGGCFWGTQKFLSRLHGVIKTEAGYANGGGGQPTYEEVCRSSGHAEAVWVRYDDRLITLPFLLSLYAETIDPTALNHQGGDHGIQYRTGIYYIDPDDRAAAEALIAALAEKQAGLVGGGKPIVIEVAPLTDFWPAEDYHQDYLDKFPGGYCHINHVKMDRAARVRDPQAAGE